MFPDAKSKKEETGNPGDGWAFSNNIVEVYNEKTKLDPFHELAHIISGEVGNPPAMLDEGFAIYVSEKLGTDALKYLHPKAPSTATPTTRGTCTSSPTWPTSR